MFSASRDCCAARHWDIGRPHADEAAEILHGRYHQELFGGPGEAAQFQAREAEVPFHMAEQHLDLAAQTARGLKLRGILQGDHRLTRRFVPRNRKRPFCAACALAFKWAILAVHFPLPGTYECGSGFERCDASAVSHSDR